MIMFASCVSCSTIRLGVAMVPATASPGAEYRYMSTKLVAGNTTPYARQAVTNQPSAPAMSALLKRSPVSHSCAAHLAA